MLLGQILPGQMAPGQLEPALDVPRNLPFIKIWSITAEIFLIWLNVTWTNIAWTNATMASVLVLDAPRNQPLRGCT